MTDQQKPKQATHKKTNKSAAKPAKKSGGLFGKLVALALVAGVGVGGYLGYLEARKYQSILNDKVAQLDAQQIELSRLGELLMNEQQQRQRLQAQLSEQNKSIAAFSGFQYQLNELTAALSGASEADRILWTIHELEFLVRMAQERMIISKDVVSARSLLHAADEQLKKISDPQVNDIRAALAQDVLALSLYEPVDSVGLYARVAALQNSLSALTVNTGESDVINTPAGELPWWKRVFDVFGVSYSTTQQLKLVPPTEAELYKRQLSLTLEQALLAISSSDNNLWVNSLERASIIVSTYYVADHSKQAHLDEIAALKLLSVANDRIRINATSAALEAYKQSRMEAAE